MPSPQEHLQANRSWQAYYDEQFREMGLGSAPAPKLDQTVNDYRRETMRALKRAVLPQNHALYKVQWRGLARDVLDRLEPQLLQTAAREAWNPSNVPPGELRERIVRDPRNGYAEHRFVGQDSFIRLPNFGCDMQATGGFRPGRRVVSFRTGDHYVDASGRALR